MAERHNAITAMLRRRPHSMTEYKILGTTVEDIYRLYLNETRVGDGFVTYPVLRDDEFVVEPVDLTELDTAKV